MHTHKTKPNQGEKGGKANQPKNKQTKTNSRLITNNQPLGGTIINGHSTAELISFQ